MRLAPLLLAATTLVAVATSAGCGYRARVGDHDAGSGPTCGAAGDCGAGSHCVCNRCVPVDDGRACDPPCATVQPGDLCTTEGRTCAYGPCGRLECRGGTFQNLLGVCEDAGGPTCECPPPPPGCVYDGSPCPCDHLTCEGDRRCGRVLCDEGLVCCNANCGICSPPGAGCPPVACEPDCSPMDARASGPCDAIVGVVWNGTACVTLSGCSCTGADCPHAFETRDECERAFAACGGESCGGFAGFVCPPDQYCDYLAGSGDACGAADGAGVCRPRPTVCPPVYAPVCGCDGMTYPSACDAHGAGFDIYEDGPCAVP